MQNLDKIIGSIQQTQKTLYILCGFPYAGKTYIARRIVEQTDVVYVSVDTIFHDHGFDWDSDMLPDAKAWDQIFGESYERTGSALIGGSNVLYDSTNQTVASRDKLRDVARSVGADTKVLYVKSSIESVWKRWEENQRNQVRSVVSRDLVQKTIDMFEEPTDKENLIVINN